MLDRRLLRLALVAAAVACFTATAPARGGDIALAVDATAAPRRIFHSTLTLPATPGPLALYYPKWIPGEHGPTGPITELTGIRIVAGGQTLPWRRDPLDMHAIECDVPTGASSVTVDLDFLSAAGEDGFTAGAGATARLAILDWHLILLYPRGKPARELTYAASLKVPPEWTCGGSLEIERREGDTITFKPVTLETLVDTPMVIGRHHRRIDLAPGQPVEHCVEMVADGEAALQVPAEREAGYRKLIAETHALMGHRHYDRYRFLLSLSDDIAQFGLEHHQTSDNRVGERYFIDEFLYEKGDGLLSHEYVHSWCGKYRRPAGLATPDFEQPMKDDLLWVYEGLTSYLGEILAARSDLYTHEGFLDLMAVTAADLTIPGRTWRPLQDTCDDAQHLYEAGDAWASWRRGVDFYGEGVMLWLEMDTMIRAQTEGKKSLDDFCRTFLGGDADGPPEVRPYTFDDIVAGLNAVAPRDWKTHLLDRLTSVNAAAPLGGLEAGGWKLVFTDEPNSYLQGEEDEEPAFDARFSVGLKLDAEGRIIDVWRGSPADRAGLSPGMTVIGVNGRRLTPDRLRDALRAAKGSGASIEATGPASKATGVAGKATAPPIELLVENNAFFSTHTIDYHDGERYPHLTRDNSKPDLLGQIIKSRSGG